MLSNTAACNKLATKQAALVAFPDIILLLLACLLTPPHPQLSGQLPDTYSALSKLTTLVLNNNKLSLSVPPTWSQLASLTSAYLYNNSELAGCLPAGWKARFAADYDAEYYLLEGTGLSGYCGTS